MDARGQWEELVRALKGGDYAAAKKIIDLIISSEPENPNNHLKRGDICLKIGDRHEAANSYIRAAWYLKKAGALKKALAVYNMVLRVDPDNDEALRDSGRILMEIESRAREKEQIFPDVVDTKTATAATSLPDRSIAEVKEPFSHTYRIGERMLDERDFAGEVDQPAGRESSQRDDMQPPETGFLSSLSDGEMTEILSRAEIRRFSDGQKVVREGDTGDCVYVIRSGSASVLGHFFGREVALATLSEGDVFGEVAFLTGRTRTADVLAVGDLEVYEINRPLLEEIITKSPEKLGEIHDIYVTRVRETVRKVKAR